MNDFLKGGEDFWLTMDDDNPPTKNPLDLIELDCDIIGMPTPVWHSAVKGDRPYYFNALDAEDGGWKPHEFITSGIEEVDAVGSGCMLISRRVMLAMQDDLPFMRQWKANGRVDVGCDYSFCRKAKAKGFRIWSHPEYVCNHFNELPLLEVIESFGAMR